jgi:hypothetical protein
VKETRWLTRVVAETRWLTCVVKETRWLACVVEETRRLTCVIAETRWLACVIKEIRCLACVVEETRWLTSLVEKTRCLTCVVEALSEATVLQRLVNIYTLTMHIEIKLIVHMFIRKLFTYSIQGVKYSTFANYNVNFLHHSTRSTCNNHVWKHPVLNSSHLFV